jgi:hypothetical protein
MTDGGPTVLIPVANRCHNIFKLFSGSKKSGVASDVLGLWPLGSSHKSGVSGALMAGTECEVRVVALCSLKGLLSGYLH